MLLKKNYVYRYKENEQTPLCIYLCDTQARNRIVIIPLTEKQTEYTYKLSVTRQYADLDNYREINISAVTSALFLNSKPVRIPEHDLNFIRQYVLHDLMKQICDDITKRNTSQFLFESIYQFLNWKHQKLLLNITEYKSRTTIFENGIYWVSLGINVGAELNKHRPVLVWKKRCGGDQEANFSYIVIPITSKEKSQKYYMNVPININGKNCYLRIEDMRRISIRRFTRPFLDGNNQIIFISDEKRKEIMTAIKQFYIFENKHKNS